MNRYKWNEINSLEDLVFVVDIETRVNVLTNSVCDELVRNTEDVMSMNIADLYPSNDAMSDPITEIVKYLDVYGGECVYEFTQDLGNTVVDIQLTSGYFDEAHKELYFKLKGYGKLVELLRFRTAISKLPDMIAVLEFDDRLSFYFGNDAFDSLFSSGGIPFADWSHGSFLEAIPEELRTTYLAQIKKDINENQKSSLVIQHYGGRGNKHYAMLSITYLQDVLDHPFLCATISTADKSVEQFLRLQDENEIFSATHKLSNNTIFKVHIPERKVQFFGESVVDFYVDGVEYDFGEEILRRNLIYKDDVDTFKELIDNFFNGIQKNTKMRLNSKDGRHDWYSVEYIINKNPEGKPVTASGKLTNIQKHQEYEDKAMRDLLTGCYNKMTFEELVTKSVNEEPEGIHAYIMLDLDNFKGINDSGGHQFGDIVLKEVSDKLRKVFRATDYIGRIGGDEFAVFVRNISPNEESAIRDITIKAQELLKALDITYNRNKTITRITSSVGVVLVPRDGRNAVELSEKADLALYHSKHLGKNQFAFYDDRLVKGTMSNRTPIDVANRALSAHFNQEIAMDVFNLLFENVEDDESLDMVLRHLGNYFNVDRCYIFEADEVRADYYDNTYEWCREGVKPQIDLLQDVHLTEFQELFDAANEDNVYYCNDISTVEHSRTRELLEVQGIQSVVMSFVKREGRVGYVLGFDDCSAKRKWEPVEISTLTYASKIIAQYLLYKKSINIELEETREKMRILDSLNFFAYVVDVNTYEILYHNEAVVDVVDGVQNGMVCYHALRGNNDVCEDCPLRVMKENNSQKVRMVIHNDKLSLDVLVTASYLTNYDGVESAFISSTDIADIAALTNLNSVDKNKLITFD